MAGFLDPKQRVMDVIITELGRQQMMKGEFDVKYFSFSDKGVDYQDAGDGVLEPITERLFFEAYHQASDEIIPEVDSLGKFIIDQQVPGDLEVRNGILYELTGSQGYSEIDGYSRVTTFTDNTLERFASLEILNSISSVSEFSIDKTSFETKKLLEGTYSPNLPTGIEALIPLSIDPRFENQINMKYLPPIVRSEGAVSNIRSFNKWTSTEENSELFPTLDSLTMALEEIKSKSVFEAPTTITFGPSNTEDYKEYNILGQVFTKKKQSIKKYVIIDAGEYFDSENVPIARIFFLGFVHKDHLGITKFCREFSFVFRNGEI